MTENHFGHFGAFLFGTFMMLFRTTSDYAGSFLLPWFTRKTVTFCTEQCTTPLLFHNFEVSQGARNHSLNNYGFHFGTSFS